MPTPAFWRRQEVSGPAHGAVLVRDARATDPPALGIFTTTGLQKAILHGTPLDQLPVGELANFRAGHGAPKE
jgi:hypothetical protein